MTTRTRIDITATIKARIRARNSSTPEISLQDWRKSYDLTQDGLARALGVNLFTVKKWEGGDRKPIGFLGLALAAIAAQLSPTKIDNTDAGNSLTHWRKARSMTQEALAVALDVNLFTIKKWEGGSRRSIDFLGLALAAHDADLVPVKLKFERREALVPEDNLLYQPKKPF